MEILYTFQPISCYTNFAISWSWFSSSVRLSWIMKHRAIKQVCLCFQYKWFAECCIDKVFQRSYGKRLKGTKKITHDYVKTISSTNRYKMLINILLLIWKCNIVWEIVELFHMTSPFSTYMDWHSSRPRFDRILPKPNACAAPNAKLWPYTTDIHKNPLYCNHVILSAMASQITSVSIIYSTVFSGADQRSHQSSASLASGHRWIPHTKGQYRGKCFHLMMSSCENGNLPSHEGKSCSPHTWSAKLFHVFFLRTCLGFQQHHSIASNSSGCLYNWGLN